MTETKASRYMDYVTHFPFETTRWDGSVTVCFGHGGRGWILLWISCSVFTQDITIFTSAAFDPYPDLIHWLENIIHSSTPSDLNIDEEGVEKILRAIPLEDDLLDFQILDRDEEDQGRVILLRVRVPKRQLISEFVRKLDLFIEEYYQREKWHHGFDLARLDLSKLREYLRVEVD